jgi:hypothetical protein
MINKTTTENLKDEINKMSQKEIDKYKEQYKKELKN